MKKYEVAAKAIASTECDPLFPKNKKGDEQRKKFIAEHWEIFYREIVERMKGKISFLSFSKRMEENKDVKNIVFTDGTDCFIFDNCVVDNNNPDTIVVKLLNLRND
jgi:hypothetical protein